jgi:hypothetical protein
MSDGILSSMHARKALAAGVQSGESSASEDTVKPTPEHAAQRFEHYEVPLIEAATGPTSAG